MLFILILLSLTAVAYAQNATQALKVALSNSIELKFYSSYYGGTQTMNFNSVNDYANGKTTGWQILVARSNKDYDITVKANAAHFSYTGAASPSPSMPISILSVGTFYNGTGGQVSSIFRNKYAPISASDQLMISNARRGNFRYFFTRYKANPGFAYPAGTYTTEVVYTATQQ